MTDLITRLSKLDAPDREVDWEIQKFFMGEWLHKHGYKREGDYYRTETPPVSGAKICSGPEYYTASVDAAIALAERVLPGWGFFLRSDKDGHNCGMVYPLYNFVTPGTASGATAAISMCIAILRAKEASKL